MNKVIFIAIGLLVGGAAGCCVTYGYSKKKYDKILKNETEDYRKEIADLRSICGKLQNKKVKELNEEKEKIFKDEHPVVVENTDDILEEDDNDDSEYYVEPTKNDDIRFISKKDYEDDDDYEKEVIEYYMGNDVFIQEEEELEHVEFETVCGPDILPLLRKDKSLRAISNAGDNELYIRNEKYSTDYRIIRKHSTYNI